MGQQARGHLAMLAFSALIAGAFSFGSRIANDIDSVALTALRFALASALIGAAVLAGPGLRRAHFVAPWRYLVLGGTFAIYFVLMFEGLKTAPPISTSAVFTLTPILSGIFGWLMLRQVTTPRMAVALAVGGAGALWVIFRADLQALLALDVGRGEMIYFVGVVAHAAYTPLVRKLNRGEPPLVFTFGMLLAALAILLAYSAPELMRMDWAGTPTRVWWVLLYLAIFSSAMTFVLLQYAALRLPSAKVMAYTYLTPSWVIGLEFLLGAGVPPIGVLAGVTMTIIALVMLLKDEAG